MSVRGNDNHINNRPSVVFNNCNIYENVATWGVYPYSTGAGGGVYIEATSAVADFIGCNISANVATGASCNNPLGCWWAYSCEEQMRSAAGECSKLEEWGCDCSGCPCGNEAGGRGGGVALKGSPTVSFANCIIASNTASAYGGGVDIDYYKGGSAGYTFSGCTIESNTAVHVRPLPPHPPSPAHYEWPPPSSHHALPCFPGRWHRS